MRSAFGGTSADWLLDPYTFGSRRLLALQSGTTTLTFWDAFEDGDPHTDLLDPEDDPATQIVVEGYQIPRFHGPDDVIGMWADKGDGSPREFMEAQDLAAAADLVEDITNAVGDAIDGHLGGPAEDLLDGSGVVEVDRLPDVVALSRPLFFDRESPAGNQEIYCAHLDGTNPFQLTSDDDYQCWWPKVSPDGKRVLFLRVPAAQTNYDSDVTTTSLWVMNVDGSGVTEIIPQGTYTVMATPNWHPDGHRIAFCGGTGANLIRTIRSDGSDYQTVTVTGISTGVGDVAYSPDGTSIAFTYSSNIYAVSVGGGNAIALTTDGGTTPNFDPNYSPDGAKIAILTNTGAVDGSHPLGQWAIRVMNADGSGLVDVIDDENVNSKPEWSNDGRIYFHRLVQVPSVDPDGFQLAWIYADGSGSPEQISTEPVRHGYPCVAHQLSAKRSRPISVRSATYYAKPTDDVIATTETAAIDIHLPDPTVVPVGTWLTVKNTKAYTVTVDSLGTSKTIDGTASKALAHWQSATYISDGTQWLTLGRHASPQVDVFTASGSYTVPAGAKRLHVVAVGPGGGGGSGRRGAAASVRCGGGGGGGGGISDVWFDATALGATLTVTVGAAGTAGAAVTANDTNGNAGGNGGGVSVTDGATPLIFGWPGGGGGGGTNAAGTAGAGGFGSFLGIAGGAASGSGGAGSASGPTTHVGGGGAGGGISAADAASAGGNGGIVLTWNTAATAGGAINNAGANGPGVTSGAAHSRGGQGGGGGGSHLTAAAGAGGTGGHYGGGGGGGGAAVNGNNSGAGGVGGSGAVIIAAYF